MLSPPSEQFRLDRLERILELVTEHERVYREQVSPAGSCWKCSAAVEVGQTDAARHTALQDIRLADLAQKVTELDVRCTTETAHLLPLKVGEQCFGSPGRLTPRVQACARFRDLHLDLHQQ